MSGENRGRRITPLALAIAVSVIGIAVICLLPSRFRSHVAQTLQELRGGHPSERAARRRILADIILSQLKGPDQARWWLQYTEGLDSLPVSTAAERQESLTRLSYSTTSQTETWAPSGEDIGPFYGQFLSALATEAETRGELSKAEIDAWDEFRRSFAGPQKIPLDKRKINKLSQWFERLRRRRINRVELAEAANKLLIFQYYPGGLREAFATEPSYEDDKGYVETGRLIYTYVVNQCDATLFPIGSPGRTGGIEARTQVAIELRDFAIEREWLDTSLLDSYRTSGKINGIRFFGPGGPLHLIPSRVIVSLQPIFLVDLPTGSESTLSRWITDNSCCEVRCNDSTAVVDRASVRLEGHTLISHEANVRPEVFALISRVY